MKGVETKQNFYNTYCLEKDFKSRFVCTYFINQTLTDTHYSTNSNGNAKCVSQLPAVDPPCQPSHREYVFPSTKILL